MRFFSKFIIINLIILSFVPVSFSESNEELAKSVQNPVSDLISLPFQNNLHFRVGPHKEAQNVLNIQPVWPFSINKHWNIITRTIIPVISQPPMTSTGRTFGLGDISITTFLSPAKTGRFIWGLGPILLIPNATDKVLGGEKWAAGPSIVILKMQDAWVYGVLLNNLWSFSGAKDRPHINFMTTQAFINYNFSSGLYLTSSPIITSNWNAVSSQRWTVPIGGGIGKILKLGKLPINAQMQAFYNVVRPSNGGNWTLRLQIQLLFPKS